VLAKVLAFDVKTLEHIPKSYSASNVSRTVNMVFRLKHSPKQPPGGNVRMPISATSQIRPTSLPRQARSTPFGIKARR
jgi:hypothetical protein